jgi:CDP-glucose 4,6-dehydratase
MAAQSLVRESYRNPIDTFEINVSGTLNILNFASKIDTLKSVLVVTTDKVYASKKTRVPYSETDKLGGSSDPYSISKSISDELTQSWRRSLSNIPISIARAGNVIGGGDYGGERLVPSIIESITRNDVPVLRNPNAVRPWQHVLDCLSGYLAIINLMEKSGVSGEWNIGPGLGESRKVYEITEIVSKLLINDSKWIGDQNKNPHEEDWLLLNVEKAHKELFWRNNLNVEEGIRWTCEWHCRIQAGEDPLEVSLNQIKRFVELINKS